MYKYNIYWYFCYPDDHNAHFSQWLSRIDLQALFKKTQRKDNIITANSKVNKPTLQCWNVSLRTLRIQVGSERITSRSGASSNEPTWRTQVDNASIICIIAWNRRTDRIKERNICTESFVAFESHHVIIPVECSSETHTVQYFDLKAPQLDPWFLSSCH